MNSALRILAACLFSSILLAAFAVQAAPANLTYTYDANGNLIKGDAKYYEYNDANQLARVRINDESGQVIAEYFYDSAGQRVKKVESGVTTYYIGKHFESVAEGSISPESASYYFASGERMARSDQGLNASFYLFDHLGNVNVVTGTSMVESSSLSYYPFGELRSSGIGRFGYGGKERDLTADLDYFEARYYSERLAHFSQPDTVVSDAGLPRALNRYSYAYNNPIRFSDPSGHVVVMRGTDEEKKTMDRYFQKLRETKKGAEVYDLLQNSKEEYYFMFRDMQAEGLRSGNTIQINSRFSTFDGLDEGPANDRFLWGVSAFGHEMVHAAYDRGNRTEDENRAYSMQANILEELGGADSFATEGHKSEIQDFIDNPEERAKASISLWNRLKNSFITTVCHPVQALTDSLTFGGALSSQ